MLEKIILIFIIINTFNSFSYGYTCCQTDESSVLHSINSQSSKANVQVTRTDILEHQENIQVFKTEHQRTSVVDKEEDFQVFRTELEEQKKSTLDKEAENLILRSELERLRKLVDGQVLRTDILEHKKKSELDNEESIHVFRTELENQKKSVLVKEAENQALRADLERLGKLAAGLVKESGNHSSSYNLHNCAEANLSGIYDIVVPKFSSQPFKVACDAETREGGWTIILRRMDGSVNFHRNWMENKIGFGNLDGEFFIGLDKIHALTTDRRNELLVLLEDNDGIEAFETYDEFEIGNEDTQYILHTVGTAKGTAGDSLTFHRGMKFTTYDNDNDDWPGVNCALARTGGWWYKNCQHSQLMGTYKDKDGDKGVLWASWRGWRYSLKKATMMIRPKN